MNKYTVTGNVNSRGTKYKVIEIIEAQDENIANSIFKERAKRNLGGVRNVTKVKVEAFKDGDEASKEEIVENLPKAENIFKQTTHKDLEDFAGKIIDNVKEIKKRTLEKIVNSEEAALIKVSLRDKLLDKPLVTAYKILYVPRLNEISKQVENISNFYDLDKKSQSSLISAIIKDEMPYISSMFDKDKHTIAIYELDWNEECFSNKEITNILNTIEGEPKEVQLLASKLAEEVVRDLGIDIDILADTEIRFIGR